MPTSPPYSFMKLRAQASFVKVDAGGRMWEILILPVYGNQPHSLDYHDCHYVKAI
jgi:hypothetical protein